MDDNIEIRYSKAFTYFMLIIMLGLVAFLTFVVLTGDPTQWKGNGLVGVGVMDVVCFAFVIYLITKFLIPASQGQSAVILTRDFLIDNIRHNKIEWDNVKAIRTVSSRSSDFIAIDLYDNQKLTSQTNNIFKKVLYASNKFFYGTPVLIATNFLDGSTKEITNVFTSFFERQKQLAT